MNFACVADYTKDIVEAIIKQMKSKSDSENLQKKNHNRIITKEQRGD